jgi:membrane protein implicated in regulation of membrane protease activity
VVCLTLAIYGMGVLPVNWFGIIFLLTAFVLFILDIKAPTHGALTTAGVASFIIGALVLFNSPGVPQFQRVSVPLVVATGFAIGLFFMVILMYALRALKVPVSAGVESLIGKIGTARTLVEVGGGQVQLGSELWSAASGSRRSKRFAIEGEKSKVTSWLSAPSCNESFHGTAAKRGRRLEHKKHESKRTVCLLPLQETELSLNPMYVHCAARTGSRYARLRVKPLNGCKG